METTMGNNQKPPKPTKRTKHTKRTKSKEHRTAYILTHRRTKHKRTIEIMRKNEKTPKIQELTETQREICTNMILKTYQTEPTNKNNKTLREHEPKSEEQHIYKC